MQNPSVAPIVPISLGGEARGLKFGFRAFRYLQVNPFNPDEINGYFGGAWSPEKVCHIIIAGLLHEYAKNGPREGQKPPEDDDLIDILDLQQCPALIKAVNEALEGDDESDKPEGKPEPSANPPLA
jgi:hypothetical protein